MINLVLCGGAGKRLWPLSAGDTPKQFVQFGTEESLYVRTLRRNIPLCDRSAVTTDQKYADTADAQVMRAKIPAEIIMEPYGKGTSAAIAIACLLYPGEMMLVTPADHEISDIPSYEKTVREAKALAEDGSIVLLAAKAEKPEDRYGFIKTDGLDVVDFYEKPDMETAKRYLSEGYVINTGIMCFKTDVMLHELLRFVPDQISIARAVYENKRSGRATHRLCGRFMGEMKTMSIEKAVLEKTDKLKCVTGINGWRDVGIYSSIHEHRRKTAEQNVSLNLGDSFGCADFIDSKGCLVINKELDVVVAGLENVVVVESNGKILVAHKDANIAEALKKLESDLG